MLTLEAVRETPTNKQIEDYLNKTGWIYQGTELSPEKMYIQKMYHHPKEWVLENIYLRTFVQPEVDKYHEMFTKHVIWEISRLEKVDELTAYNHIMGIDS